MENYLVKKKKKIPSSTFSKAMYGYSLMLPLKSNINYMQPKTNIYKFDGIDDYIEIPDNNLDISTKFTLIIWGKQHNYVQNAGLIDKYITSNGKRSFRICTVNNDELEITISSDGINYDFSTSGNNCGFEDKNETLIVITFNAGAIKYYHNGIEKDTDTNTQTSVYNSTTPLLIGCRNTNSISFDGNIYETAILNEDLDATTISDIYSAGKCNYDYSLLNGVVFHEDLVNNATLGKDNVIDLSGNGNTGTSYGKGEFTRSTTGTVTDYDGTVREVGIDVNRHEGVRTVTNLLVYSDNLSEWNTPTTKTSNTTTDPNGNIVPFWNFEDIRVFPATNVKLGRTYTNIMYLKANKDVDVKIRKPNGQDEQVSLTTDWQSFNFTEEAITDIINANLIDARFSQGLGASGLEIAVAFAQIEENGEASEYIPTGADPRTQYFETELDGTPISDSLKKGILIEKESINVVLHSENNFKSGAYSKSNCTTLDGQIISPDGNLTGSLATDDDTNDRHIIYQVVHNVPIGTVTMSIYLKKGTHRYIFVQNAANGGNKRYGIIIDMNDFSVVYDNATGGATGGSYNVKRLDNEWCRVEVSVDQETVSICYPVVGFSDSATPTINAHGEPTYSGTGTNFYMFGLQLEEGPFATSYIKTESTTVTRTKDILSYDITDIITQGQGWLYAEFECVGQKGGTYVRVIEMNDGTNDNRILLYLRPTGLIACGVANSGVFQALINTTQKEFNILHKVLITYKDNLVRWFVDGVKINEDTLCTIPINLTTLRIGSDYNNGNQLNGMIKNVKYGKNPDLTDDEGIRRTQ